MKSAIVMIAAASVLTGCATADRYSAAGDVHDFLVAVRDDDRPAFDAHVDRAALEAQLQTRLVAEARSARAPTAVKGMGLVWSGAASKMAAAVLLRPDVFGAVAEHYGYRRETPVPGRMAIAADLRPAPQGQVCASVGRRCLLVFAHEDGAWRLVAFGGDFDMLRWPNR